MENRPYRRLPSGELGTLVNLNLTPALHPGLDDLTQKLLFVPIRGPDGGDLLVVSAQGTPETMQAQDDLITAIFASCTTIPKK